MEITTLLNMLPGACAQGLVWGIMAIGVYITYKILDIADLTVDGTMCTGGAVFVVMMFTGEYSIWTCLAAAFGAGALAGLATGLLHTVMGIPAILAGILTQLSLYSINLRVMGSPNEAISNRKYDLLVTSMRIPESILVVGIIVAALITILYLFFGTEMGSSMRATGNNNSMARAQGINTSLIKVLGLMLSNGIVALCSAVLAQYQGFADINMGRGAIVIGLAAVIIGEVIFSRIFRNFALKLLGVVLGAVLYYLVITFVLWLGMNSEDLKLLTALVVTIFISLPHLKSTYFNKRTLDTIKRKFSRKAA